MSLNKRLFFPIFWGATILTLLGFSLAAARDTVVSTADQAAVAAFPTGVDAFKIEVDGEGIYEVAKSDLVTAGFPSGASLTSYVLTNRGQTIAYQYIPTGEKLRFYATPFAGSWEEKQHVDHEIFWLWPGTPTLIANPASSASGSSAVDSYRAVVKHEVDDVYSSTKISRAIWGSQNLDPDSMYWTELVRQGTATVTKTLPITLPAQTSGSSATFRYMIAVEGKGTASAGDGTATLQVNDYSQTKSQYIQGANGANGTPYLLDHVVPASELAVNNTLLITHTPGTQTASNILLINYVEVEYDADLAAYQDQIVFNHPGSGSFDFRIAEFTTTDKDEVTFWDITTPASPVAHEVRTYFNATHRIGVPSQSGNATYIATADSALGSPTSISKYSSVDVTPAGGSADWIAITHADFKAAAQSLAVHRAGYSRLTTHVIDVEDVFNQYGYGYPTPQAIKAYLQHAYDNWPTKPSYVILVGDSNLNPRQLPCLQCNEALADWQTPYPSYIPFNYSFEDRFLGLVPSDHPYTMLEGNDIHSDIALGRLSVETAAEATNAVNKIIDYETNLQSAQSWQGDILFVHDYNKNPGDNFVGDINATLPYIPSGIDTNVIGMDVRADAPAVIADVNAALNTGVSLVNYRGHGSMTTWSHGSFINSTKIEAGSTFNNVDKPVVSISLDCLDGHFGYPGIDSLSEVLMRADNRGSAAHWSSTGLGFAYEHNILARHFYEALFTYGYSAIGDAINQAKINYENLGYHDSEVYAFLLQGDPAMQLYLPALTFTHISPFLGIKGGQSEVIKLVATNGSPFTSSNQATVTYTLPDGLTLDNVTGSGVTYTTSTDNSGQTVITAYFGSGIPGGGSVILSIHVTADTGNTTAEVSSLATLFVPGVEKSQNVTIKLRNQSASDSFIPIIAR